MKTRLFSAHAIDNPKNFTHQQMTAQENFNLVKRVIGIKSSLPNHRPQSFKHMNTHKHLRKTQQST